ncbi:hypothetical protein MKW94_017780 [Papaver nudicaule]|uniref:Uncharacterized protein n=1 Tax=Papaver nudicaule TaxID=74823 RepID=A0AA41VM66_PAPNU|nr:hypothetical protein [Papaver nudicaule]
MAKINNNEEAEEEISWGTWEELLLACAVKRHGSKNWESVANEIQNKNSSSNFIVTPQNCKQKYHDLHRRFMVNRKDIGDSEIDDQHNIPNNNNDDDIDNHNNRIPWLDELRKLRVAELRREVQEYDVSIVSLQLKVKRLKEEREQSLKDNNTLDVKPDLLENRTKEEEEDEKEIQTEPLRSPSPVEKTDKPVSGDESDRENQSFNESNSSDLKEVKHPEVEVEKIPEPVQTVTEKQDHVLVDKPVGEGSSCNGSSETIAKDPVAQEVVKKSSETTIPVGETREPAELWESVAESKGGNGEEGTKESSDVQSSASLSRKNRRRKITSGSSSGEERETDEVSPAIKRISVKSEPLYGFLEMILSHKFGSVFQSRLESQVICLIRQHIDMQTIQTRLKEGSYSGSSSRKFFRDLLLLFNNAIAFYPKNSSESVAATELRELVSKEISSISSGSSSSRSQNNPSPVEPAPPKLQQSIPPLPKPDPELSDSLLPKSKSGGLIVACRKRSSISAKAANSPKPVDLKVSDQKIVEEKPVLDKKPIEEHIVFSKRKGERSTSGTRSSRSNMKNRNNNSTNKNTSNSNQNLDPSSARNSAKGGSASGGDETNLETKTEKDKKNNSNNASDALTNTIAKKRSVTDFLNRMKRTSSSSNNGKLLETLKNSSSGNRSNTTKGEKGGSNKEEKYRGSGSGSKKDARQGSSKRQAAQESSPPKRSVGRPPKKAPPPPPSSSKRTREREKEVEPEARQPRKRTRR